MMTVWEIYEWNLLACWCLLDEDGEDEDLIAKVTRRQARKLNNLPVCSLYKSRRRETAPDDSLLAKIHRINSNGYLWPAEAICHCWQHPETAPQSWRGAGVKPRRAGEV